MTWHVIYPSLPAQTGVPWSEYIRSQRTGSRSVSSSTEALDSNHARYITGRIAQHARSMATGTRSLPTDSPVPYFQPIERGHMSEGGFSDRYSPTVISAGDIQTSSCDGNIPLVGTNYPPISAEPGIYTGLHDDYDTLFKAWHSRGALDPAPVTHCEAISAPFGGIAPTSGKGMIVKPKSEVRSTNGSLYPNQREYIPVGTDLSKMGQQVVSPSSGHIIGEGAIVFMGMTETVLDALHQQMALSTEAQKPESSLTDDTVQTRSEVMSATKDSYPDLYLPVVENYRISDKFYGYSDSFSADNNPMVLVELKGLSYHYGMSIFAVDRVNGTMYSKFDVGYRMISEKAMVKPQFGPTSLEDEYTVMQPPYVNTLPGMTGIDTPIAKSTPVTQASQMPSIPIVSSCMKDILEPSSSEEARAAY